MREVDDKQTGLTVNGVMQLLPVNGKVTIIFRDQQRNVLRRAAGQRDRRFIGVVGGIEHDDFVTRPDDCLDGTEQTFRSTIAHGDVRVAVDRASVQGLNFQSDSLPQRRDPLHRRVLIGAGSQVMLDQSQQLIGRVEARKALRQVDRAAFRGKLTHYRENGGPDVG